jgi:RND superfamily putative drug exporter
MVFRCVLLPIKAILVNLLATGATIGLVVLIFQDGHGEHLLDFTSTGFIQSTVPLIMFVMLFGLSMDYEVFLIRRMQEEWRKTGDNRAAVATGIEHTARPIAAAAAIMVAVFGSFVTANFLELKQLGFALAAAIAIDATLVRLVLIPATMRLFGKWNWWLPAWLDRVLPNLGVD